MEKISPYEFEKAPEGSLFIKKGNKLIGVSFDTLAEKLNEKCESVLNHKALEKSNADKIDEISTYLQSLAKSHFISVFSLFELKALKGEIDVEDENLLNLDEKVLNDEMSVEEALDSHEFLKTTYDKLFGKVGK